MKELNWRGIDLNLLLTFDAIMRFESVSDASKHLNLGQPATSYNLKRLRQLLGDPLFERVGHRMIPTHRAREIAPKVEHILKVFCEDVLPRKEFDFGAYDGSFKIGLTDYAEQIFGPTLFDVIQSLAPKSKIIFKPADSQNSVQMLENDEVDLCIGVFHDLPENISKTFLYREKHCCIFDNDKLKTSLPIPLDTYLSTPQMIILADDNLVTKVDKTLEGMNIQRNVVLGTTRFFTIRHMLSGRNLLAVTAEMVGRSDLFNDQLTLCPPPIDIPDFDVDMLKLKRDESHPRMVWLSAQVRTLVQSRVSQLRAGR